MRSPPALQGLIYAHTLDTHTHEAYLTVNNRSSLGRVFDGLDGFRTSLKRYRSSLESSFSVLLGDDVKSIREEE
jgi:hypothetical protein